MIASELEKALTNIIDSFQEHDTEKVLGYQRAIERYNDLEKRGLVKKRGNSLLPVEERHRFAAEYYDNR
ncbi:MAG: hypothetical protein FWF85_03685 [Clostridiales bacterium]|jgi:hypothetical protein|nr:hypothetical protein [Clostridiales bacterium]MDR2713193.1 hypothetical protein [Clostridiales bacterium]